VDADEGGVGGGGCAAGTGAGEVKAELEVGLALGGGVEGRGVLLALVRKRMSLGRTYRIW